MATSLTAALGSRFAALTLAHVAREYPNAPGLVLEGDDDLRPPRTLHPAFYGSFDWHSCVHGYWQLARLRRTFPELPQRAAIEARFDAALTPANIAVEIAYFERPLARGFERPYGWAWLLALADELSRHADDAGRRWREALDPLVALIAGRFAAYLPKAIYPVRAGTHANTAFAVTLAHAYAASHGEVPLRSALEERARAWYGRDADCQAWEPSMSDFLSPALTEATCMSAVLSPGEFDQWLTAFLPRLASREPAALFAPVTPTDRTDGQIVHLDGLNLSRAWCFRRIAAALAATDHRRPVLAIAAEEHLAASLPHVAGDYMGEHWLATFALLALTA